jgi:hypothetical protein
LLTHFLLNFALIQFQEANDGKKFSCSCGGGEDTLSKTACTAQGQYKTSTGGDGATATRFDWTFSGVGTSSSPGSISLVMNAGIHGNSWEDAPGQYDYFYPIVWAGKLESCIITEGKCMSVVGTSVSKEDCYNYNCGDTQISCPPDDLPECPGGVNSCGDVPGTTSKYQMHKVRI